MFRDPTMFVNHDLIDRLNKQANAAALGNGADERTRALAIEANQQLMEYYDEIADSMPARDRSVTVRCNGVTMKFPDENKMAEWLTGWKDW